MDILLEAVNTHLYPGHRGTLSGKTEFLNEDGIVRAGVKFSDGVTIGAMLSPTDRSGVWLLVVGPYTNAAKSRIVAKSWEVAIARGEEHSFRVLRKVDEDPAIGEG